MSPIGLKLHCLCLAILPVAMYAQPARPGDPLPLRYWPAPLYWQPVAAPSGRTMALAADPAASPAGASPLVFVAMTPCRVVDTRASQGFTGAFGPPSLAHGASRTFPMQSSTTCTIPAAAQAYSLNITVVPPGPLAFLTAYPTGQPLPLAATVNSPLGFIVGNAAIVPAGTGGAIDLFAADATDVVIDINGYYAALYVPSNSNTAVGSGALDLNTAGLGNTAVGYNALSANVTGGNNIAVGNAAATNVGGGNSGNIHIGSAGSSDDSGVIRIGTSGSQNAFFAAGVRGVTTGSSDAVPVVIDSRGQLGTVNSSLRFKEDVHDMGDASKGLMRLRPVVFRYKEPFADGSTPIQFGLIAEEVAQVYPDLVARSADGQIETVKYQVLDSMLLNEIQRQENRIGVQTRHITAQGDEISKLQQQIREQKARLSRLEAALASLTKP